MASTQMNELRIDAEVPTWGPLFLGLAIGTLVGQENPLAIVVGATILGLFSIPWYWGTSRNQFADSIPITICKWLVPICMGLLVGQQPFEMGSPVDLKGLAGVQGEIYQVEQRDGRTRFTARVGPSTDVHGHIAPGQALTSGTMVWLIGPFTAKRHSPNFKSDSGQVKWTSHHVPYVLSQPSEESLAAGFRSRIHRQISRVLHHKARQVLTAITLGKKGGMSSDLHRTFSAVGAQHLLAVSGLHIVGLSTMLLCLLIYLASWLRATNPLPIALAITLCLAFLLLCICRYPVGGVRAFMMFVLFGIGKWLGRGTSTLESLFFAASAMLIFDPEAWRTVGFLLSFSAVLGIVTQANGGNYLHQLWQASLWSSIATAPICAYFFGAFSLLAPVANLLMVPFVTLVVMPLAWLGICLGDWWPTPIHWAGESCLFFIALCQQLESYGCVAWTVGSEAWLWVCFFCLGFWLWRRSRISALVLCLAGFVLARLPQPPSIDFISVGQGDATLVRHQGEYGLIDAGPLSSGWQLARTLKRLGVPRLKVLVITHGHSDHYSGLAHLLTQYAIARVVWNGRSIADPQLQRLREQTENKGTLWHMATNEVIHIGAVLMRIMPSASGLSVSENNASIATHLEYRGSKVLLTGDLELTGELDLLEQVSTRYTVLRGGHHGSQTSSNDVFLRRICPRHLVLSMGLNNRFGFPDIDVIQRADTSNIRLWRTDRDGRISLKLDDPPTISAITQPITHLLDTEAHPISTHCLR